MSLLIRPGLGTDEGLRAYVCRLATRNLSPTLFRPMLDSMFTVTAAVPDLVGLTGQGPETLLRRGSAVRTAGRQVGGVRFGDVVLPRSVVRPKSRRVCPQCVAQDGTSRCVWDLRRFDVCDRHGLRLVEACSSCKQPLTWSYPSADRCACGFLLSRLQAQTGSSGRRRLCKVLAASMLRTIHGGPVTGDAGSAAAVPIDWTLVLCEFIAGVLIPIFSERHGLDSSQRFHAARDALTASMLEDRNYRDYLRDAVFMYASSDPMTLVSTLRPGRLDEWSLSRFEYRWSELSFHRSLWDFRRGEECRNASRAPSASIKKRHLTPVIRERGEVMAEEKVLSPFVQEAVKCLSAVRQEVPIPGWRPRGQGKIVESAAVS